MHFELVGVGEVWASLKNYEEKESGDIMIPGEVGLAVSCQLGLRSARDVPLSAPVLPVLLCSGQLQSHSSAIPLLIRARIQYCASVLRGWSSPHHVQFFLVGSVLISRHEEHNTIITTTVWLAPNPYPINCKQDGAINNI